MAFTYTSKGAKLLQAVAAKHGKPPDWESLVPKHPLQNPDLVAKLKAKENGTIQSD